MNKHYTFVFADGTEITKEDFKTMHSTYIEVNNDKLAYAIVEADKDPENLIEEIRLYGNGESADWVLNYFHDYDYNPTLIYVDGMTEKVIYQGDFINFI